MGVVEIKNKEFIKKQILLTLLDRKLPITVTELANINSISGKSVRNYLNELQSELKEKNMELIKKPRVGIYLDIEDSERLKYKAEFLTSNFGEKDFSSDYRKNYILKILFKNKYAYTIQLFAEELYCSKGTIVSDLEYVEKWLNNRGLVLQKKQNQGLWIEGEEKVYRRAMVDLFHEIKNSKKNEINELYELDYRISDVNFNRMNQFFPRVDLNKIQNIIQETEEKLGYYFTDQAFINLMTHIAITIERVKNDKSIEFDLEKFGKLKEKSEYDGAKWMLDRLSEAFEIEFPEEEIAYISIHILGSKVQQFSSKTDSKIIMEIGDKENIKIAKEIINMSEQILNVELSKDEILLTSLVLHLKPTIFRLKNGLKLRNPILDRIKKGYTSIFGAAWACGSIFENKLGISINEDEVGYIAMHIAGAVGRIDQKIKTIVVCSSGIGTSQFISTRVSKLFSDIDIVEIISINELSLDKIDEMDLIISTVGRIKDSSKIVYVSAMIDENDILKISKYIENYSKQNIIGSNENLKVSAKNEISNVISEELCFFESNKNDFVDLIYHYGKIMEDKKYVKSGFCEDVLEREKKGSTFIGNGIAIPHASQDNVIKSKICIVKLEKPIVWKGNSINMLLILALKLADITETKRFFKQFYSILDDKELIKKIQLSNDKNEIVNIFNTGGIDNV